MTRALATNGAPASDFAAVLFDEQHLVERQLRAGLAGGAVDGGDAAGRDLDLPAAALNDCVHVSAPVQRG